MTGRDLPNEDSVVRHAKQTQIRDGRLDGSAFLLKDGEQGLSVNWLDCFRGQSKSQQLNEVRRLIRLTLRHSHRFAELNVGETRERIGGGLDGIRFVHSPLDADAEFEADPSHSEILGLPPGSAPEAQLMGDVIARCVRNIHPATEA